MREGIGVQLGGKVGDGGVKEGGAVISGATVAGAVWVAVQAEVLVGILVCTVINARMVCVAHARSGLAEVLVGVAALK